MRLVLAWNNTCTPQLISSHSTRECETITSTSRVSLHQVFYFWLSGPIAWKFCRVIHFQKGRVKVIVLTETTELRVMTDIPGALPLVDSAHLCSVRGCVWGYTRAHMCGRQLDGKTRDRSKLEVKGQRRPSFTQTDKTGIGSMPHFPGAISLQKYSEK